MKNNKTILLFVFIAFFTQSVFAGSQKTGNPERKRKNSEAFTESVYKKFVKLQEMISDEKYNEARAGLEALTTKKLNNFEIANVNQYIGWVDSAEGNYVAAAKRFQKALDSDSLPNRAHFGMMLQMAQMYMAGEKYQQGINVLNAYYKVVDEIKDSTFALEANAYSQLNNYVKAIEKLKIAISLADKPKERWYYLLYSLHMERSQFREAAKVLETLIAINPNKKEYWKRLSSVYFNLKKDDKALAVLVLADKNGLLVTEKDRLHLFKMYAFLGIPYKAGKVLEQGLTSGTIKPSFKRWDELGKIWYTAAEMDNALSAYNNASKLSTDGKIDFQRAYIYFDREDWPKTRQALNSALEKGGLKDSKIGNAYLLLGMVENEMNDRPAAIRALKHASKYPKTRKSAVQWIDHLEKQAKRAKLQAAQDKSLAEEAAANAITEQE
jgi:tetratricopeptide (TPR) repeat protein